MLRHISLTCPCCGTSNEYTLEPHEDVPLVTVVRCPRDRHGGCGLTFAVEVRLTVCLETSVCRLSLPSTTPACALKDARQGPEAPTTGETR